MRATSFPPKRLLASGEFFASLPGPTRKRETSPYRYRLSYRTPQPRQPGCVLLWEVDGGRQPYQIALERETDDIVLITTDGTVNRGITSV